jgi:hypothetical protein
MKKLIAVGLAGVLLGLAPTVAYYHYRFPIKMTMEEAKVIVDYINYQNWLIQQLQQRLT